MTNTVVAKMWLGLLFEGRSNKEDSLNEATIAKAYSWFCRSRSQFLLTADIML